MYGSFGPCGLWLGLNERFRFFAVVPEHLLKKTVEGTDDPLGEAAS